MNDAMSKSLVSVVIPTYKRSDYLIRAIESVRKQTYQNLEIVIVDDNPRDSLFRKETERKIEKYKEDKRIKYIKNIENLGGALARNCGISESSGEYITFLDDDDMYLPNKIETQLEFMKIHDLEMSFSNVAIVNMKGELIDFREHRYVNSDDDNDKLLKHHLMHHLTPTGTYMFKKDALVKIGSFDNASVGQEFRLMLKTITNGLRIGYLNRTHVVQFVHDGERISIGANKIKGEKELFDLKSQYFSKLKFSEIRYIKFRYRAVLTVVGIRSKKPILVAKNAALAFLNSPINFAREVSNQFNKVKKNKEIEKIIMRELNYYQNLR